MSHELGQSIANAVRQATDAETADAVVAALLSVAPGDLEQFFHDRLDLAAAGEPLASGLPASPGAAAGRIVISADEAIAASERGESVILVRTETSPDDVMGMQAAKGVLTTRGGLVSHAAVVARGWGIPAVVGANDVQIGDGSLTIGSTVLKVGDTITIDGSSGAIYAGALATAGTAAPAELDTLLGWADELADGQVQVRANADTREDAMQARSLGATGIGLCRTEHMFLAADRLPIMRRFILADDAAAEAAALAELEAVQVTDFEQVLEAMDTLPVTVRLLDPPLHEFLPDLMDLATRAARDELSPEEQVEYAAARRLHEANPMLGTRGVRLAFLRRGLYEMQARALCRAASNLFERGLRPHVEIMIPLVVDAAELQRSRAKLAEILDEIGHPELGSDTITIGVMIETPRAALTAGAIAEFADFFSFGTNDLTQMTYAFSRDDVEAKLLPTYQAAGLLTDNPFAVLDQAGVGRLVKLACDEARAVKPDIKLGVCGEHAGHPDSTRFLVSCGLSSVSCSPYRVPLARLSVAQGLLDSGRVTASDVAFTFPETVTAPRASASTVDIDFDVSIDEAAVLHTMRIRGFVTPDGFVESLGGVPTEILAALSDAELIRHIPARDMYSLLPAGKQRQESLLDSYATDEVRAGLGDAYERFLVLNNDFKELCTNWQMKGDEPNDHSDAAYDAECVSRLRSLIDSSFDVIVTMTIALPRMARYQGRLATATEAVESGETKRFTGVMCESVHDIWMELHEDLVVLQRIDRVHEGSF